MFQDIEKLLNNHHSLEQIDQFTSSYEANSEVFKAYNTIEFQSKRASSAKLTRDSATETASSSKPQNEVDDSSQDISVSEPSSKRRKLNDNNFPNNFDESNLEAKLVLSAFLSFILDSTIAIKEKLEDWNYFRIKNQRIDTSALLPALKDCIKMMKNVEVLIPYSSFRADDLNASFKVALKTADRFHDFLSDAALLILPMKSFDGVKDKQTRKRLLPKLFEHILPKNHVVPKEFFDNPIFIEFCIKYSHLLLQNNCHKLRGKTVSMVDLRDFADQNRPYVDLINTYQTILELRSVDQTATEMQNGILYDLKERALTKVDENLHSSSQNPDGFERFLKANKELINIIMLEESMTANYGVQNCWMGHHVPKLLDLRPNDIRLFIGNLYINHDPSDGMLESRRLYTSFIPSESDSDHIQTFL